MRNKILNKEKTAIFIDGDYMYHLTKKLNFKIDFAIFRHILNQMFEESIIYYYSSINPEAKYYKSHQSFLNHLSKFGYIIKASRLRKIKKTEEYISDLDIHLALDAIKTSKVCNKIVLVSGDADFVPLVKSIKENGKEVILLGLPLGTSFHLRKEASQFYDLRKIFSRVGASNISKKIKSSMKIQNTPRKVFIDTGKENRFKKEIKRTLKELEQMIKDKKTETELHKFIKEKGLISAPFIQHEFNVLIQNREDFLIKNEFGEFEIWELKSPKAKLFEVNNALLEKSERYNKLKALSKTNEFVKSIEQLSIYKKEFIDHNKQHPQDHSDLHEHIYNAKLMLVIGSNEELEGENEDLYLEKLNLERYMLNNMNIITWEMFYERIESYYKQFLDN